MGNSYHFVKFAEAVEWVEKEILELANEPDVEEGRANSKRGRDQSKTYPLKGETYEWILLD